MAQNVFNAAGAAAQEAVLFSQQQSDHVNDVEAFKQNKSIGGISLTPRKNYLQTHKSNLKVIQDQTSALLGNLDAQIKKLNDKEAIGPLSPADLAQRAQYQDQRTKYNAAYGKFLFETATKYAGEDLGLSNDQKQLLQAASTGKNGINFDNVDLSAVSVGNKPSSDKAKNTLSDAQTSADANAKTAADAAALNTSNKAAADATAATFKSNTDANDAAFVAAGQHAASLVNTGLNTFDTALSAKQGQVSSLASDQVHNAGFADATAQGANASTNVAAKGAAARGTLGSDLDTQASTYLSGVAGDQAKNAASAQGLRTGGQVQTQSQNTDTTINTIKKMQESGQISATGQEQQIHNLLQEYQNENTSAENKTKLAGQIIGMAFGAAGTAATAAILA